MSKHAQTIFLAIILLVALKPMRSLADDIQYQKGSETAVEETEEMKDGKKVRTIRQGTVKSRKGEARVGEIEDDEIHQIERRQKSLSLASFGFGPFGSANIGASKMLYGVSYGHHWEVSTMGEIVLEGLGVLNGDGNLFNVGLGFNLLPMTTQFSPIVGAEFGFGTAYGKNPDNDEKLGRAGFSLQANVGARMFRLASTQMEILGTYTTVLSSPNFGVFGAQLRILF